MRAGNAIQMAMELPSGALAKVGAGTAAVAVAGAAGAPLVADAVRPESPPAPVAAIERAASTTPATARAATTPRRSEAKAAPFPAARRRAASAGTSRQVAAAARRPARAVLPSKPDPPPTTSTATRAAAPSPAPAPAPVDAAPAPGARPGPGRRRARVRPVRRVRRTAALGALLALAAAPAAAEATDGALYGYGASVWAARAGIAATVQAGPVWLVQAPALNPAGAGNLWEMNWGCPVPGSEIAAVLFGALRTQAPSSLAVAVTGDRQALWIEGDVGMPQSPAGGRAYHVGLPGGQCNVHLTLTQMETRAQHARGYFIDNPRVFVRDVAPPAAVLRHLTPGWIAGGSNAARVDWSAADNFGTDGTALQRVSVAGHVRWAGAPGVGDHSIQLPLDGIGDGVHRVAVEVDGDGTGGAVADGVIHLDRTPPAAGQLAAAATPGGGASLHWSVADNLSGAGASSAQVNAAGDGSTAGAWETLAGATGPGPHTAAVAVGVPDGVHAWRVVAADGAGNAGATPAPDRIIVDTTPPSVELHDVPGAWVRALDLDLTATDNLQSALGLGPTQIDVNAAADGGDAGEWLPRGSAVAAPGRRMVPVELGGLADGRHVVRVVVRNGGPFGATLATERRATVRVDRTPPTVARATFTPGAGGLTAAWVADDALAGVEVATVQWRDGSAWRTLGSQRAVDGSGSMAVDVSSVPLGERVLRVVITDGAGNVAARQGEARIARAGAGSTAADPFARLRSARLSLTRGRRAMAAPGGPAVARRTDRRRRDRHDHRPPPGRGTPGRSRAPRSGPAGIAGRSSDARSRAGTGASGSSRAPRPAAR